MAGSEKKKVTSTDIKLALKTMHNSRNSYFVRIAVGKLIGEIKEFGGEMKYKVCYKSKPGMWDRYTGIKEVEADGADEAIEKAYRLIRRDFPDRSRSGWYFTVN